VKTWHRLANALLPVVAVAAAFLVGGLVVTAIGESPFRIYAILFRGAFGSVDAVGLILFNACPLIFAGLAVAFAFRAGLFNIGAEGQLTVGAFLATMVGLHAGGAPAIVLVPLCVLAAAAGGAVWGAIPGLLRAKLGVHEVINTIMMNFIASGLTGYLTVYVFKEPGQMIPHTARIAQAARIPRLGDVPIPGNPQLSGIKVLFQFWGIDLGACGGISMSRGLEVTIG